MFPCRIQPLATIIGTATFRFLLALKICRPIKKELDLGVDFNTIEETGNEIMPDNREAERKRYLIFFLII